MWQDLIFLAGSVLSLVFLVPTLRNPVAKVPLGTSLPSALIGGLYGAAFFSLGMTLSGAGAVLTGLVWSLIAAVRSPASFRARSSTDANPSAESSHVE